MKVKAAPCPPIPPQTEVETMTPTDTILLITHDSIFPYNQITEALLLEEGEVLISKAHRLIPTSVTIGRLRKANRAKSVKAILGRVLDGWANRYLTQKGRCYVDLRPYLVNERRYRGEPKAANDTPVLPPGSSMILDMSGEGSSES